MREGDLFVDIGANVGTYTVLASSIVGEKVCCFEPVPSTYDRLITNIRLNNFYDKVKALNLALGHAAGEVCFTSDQNCMDHVIPNGEISKETIIVNISTLDEILSDCPFLIKIDVEGYETSVLEGSIETLENNKLCAVIMELNGSGDRYGKQESKILSMMTNYGFSTYSYSPFERKLINLQGKNP